MSLRVVPVCEAGAAVTRCDDGSGSRTFWRCSSLMCQSHSRGFIHTSSALLCFSSSSNTSPHHHTACLSSSPFLLLLFFLFLPSFSPPHGFASAPQSVSLSFILSALPAFSSPVPSSSLPRVAWRSYMAAWTTSLLSPCHFFFLVFSSLCPLYPPSTDPSHHPHPPSCLTLCLIKKACDANSVASCHGESLTY